MRSGHTEPYIYSATGSYGWLADKIQVIFEIYKIYYRSTFHFVLQMYNIITVVPMR